MARQWTCHHYSGLVVVPRPFADKLMHKIDISTIDRCYEEMMRAYAKDYMSVQQQKEEYVQKLERVLNR